MKSFNIPPHYRSQLINLVKNKRKRDDPRKMDFSPSVVDFGPVKFYLARHFGFCYGVENAIEIAYRAREENPEKRVLLLSQMIHNPQVNQDLQDIGIGFIMDTEGNHFIQWDELKADDIVIIPAFGTTLEIEDRLTRMGVETKTYNTTCPFVERVWNKTEKLGEEQFTIVIHGKPNHEETRATFSHSRKNAPSIVIRNLGEAEILGSFITGERPLTEFDQYFQGRYCEHFRLPESLHRLGVVNQTTMLASDTQQITDHLRQALVTRFGESALKEHFADTRDTLCYATNDNQRATHQLLETDADLAIVVGGYNSSNTSHIVHLCEQRFPTYFVSGEDKLISPTTISHFIYDSKLDKTTESYLPEKSPLNVVLTSGASCPDAVVERVMLRLLSFLPGARSFEDVISEWSPS
jgi:4-hydroxy-3-methylbut-2-enyl diphosphate reductase